jgi:DMSO reductase anchor subunit
MLAFLAVTLTVLLIGWAIILLTVIMMFVLITLAFIAIIASLGAALFFMLRGSSKSSDATSTDSATKLTQRNKSMAKALTVRVGVSVVLFICVLIAWKLGYIQPRGLPIGK